MTSPPLSRGGLLIFDRAPRSQLAYLSDLCPRLSSCVNINCSERSNCSDLPFPDDEEAGFICPGQVAKVECIHLHRNLVEPEVWAGTTTRRDTDGT